MRSPDSELALSIVVPVYNEGTGIAWCYEVLTETLANGPDAYRDSYEIVFVDDGSTDASFESCAQLQSKDPRTKVIRFRRNFGKTAAMQAGFAKSRGSRIVTIDADLQEDPSQIFVLLDRLDAGYDLVSGWRRERHDPLNKTLPSAVFNRVVSIVSGVHLHDFNCGFKAYRREVIEDISLYGAQHRFVPLLAAQRGYRVTEVAVEHRPRRYGKSKFGVRRYGQGYLDFAQVMFLTTYLQRPLRLFGAAGTAFGGLGTIILLYLTVLWLLGDRPIGNRPLLFLGILLVLSGLQLFSTGLLGEMLRSIGRKDSDEYVVTQVLDNADDEHRSAQQ